ncbi:hypothetical protein Q8A73_017692 [Channa argus]|nr:hypothetical protein Q8A73_017692 [Channa argus]
MEPLDGDVVQHNWKNGPFSLFNENCFGSQFQAARLPVSCSPEADRLSTTCFRRRPTAHEVFTPRAETSPPRVFFFSREETIAGVCARKLRVASPQQQETGCQSEEEQEEERKGE